VVRKEDQRARRHPCLAQGRPAFCLFTVGEAKSKEDPRPLGLPVLREFIASYSKALGCRVVALLTGFEKNGIFVGQDYFPRRAAQRLSRTPSADSKKTVTALA